jgi:hypothetical protein
MIYIFIRNNEKIFPIEKMCKVLQVGQRSYYQWKSGSVSDRKQRAELVKEKITSIYFDSKQRYGSPRMTAELASLGDKLSRITVAKYMNQLGLRSKLSKKFKVTTYSKHKYLIVPNVLNRENWTPVLQNLTFDPNNNLVKELIMKWEEIVIESFLYLQEARKRGGTLGHKIGPICSFHKQEKAKYAEMLLQL